jgi:hypothetical protein
MSSRMQGRVLCRAFLGFGRSEQSNFNNVETKFVIPRRRFSLWWKWFLWFWWRQSRSAQPLVTRCSAVQFSAVQCSAVQCSAVQCSAMPNPWSPDAIRSGKVSPGPAVWCSAVQCSAVQCSAVQYDSTLASAGDRYRQYRHISAGIPARHRWAQVNIAAHGVLPTVYCV